MYHYACLLFFFNIKFSQAWLVGIHLSYGLLRRLKKEDCLSPVVLDQPWHHSETLSQKQTFPLKEKKRKEQQKKTHTHK
jgi:hypothetical protein